MNNHASVMLHVAVDLGEIKIDHLLAELRGLGGVQQAQLGAGSTSHHLILVQYDSGAISAQDILGHVTGRGLTAQLVGM